MNGLPALLAAYDACRAAGVACVWLTVVGVRGSAYRQPGARMLVAADGRRYGTISGGCLEAQVCRDAWDLTADASHAVVSYDTRSDDDLLWGYAMGCKGLITLLFDRVGPEDDSPAHVEEVRRCLAERRPAVIPVVRAADPETGYRPGDRPRGRSASGSALTCVPASATASPASSRMPPTGRATQLQQGHPGHRRSATHGGIPLPDLAADADDVLRADRPILRTYDLPAGQVEVFFDLIRPPTRLLVFGAGDDAIPLVRFAAALGWHVAVVDRRPLMATRERFPDAARVIAAPVADGANDDAGLVAPDAVVVMNHHFPSDVDAARLALAGPARYVGVLGPRPRTRAVLADAGVSSAAADDPRLFSPAGLDLGGETPEEVALSIVAEVKAVLARRPGSPLRDRAREIHDRGPDEEDRAAESGAVAASCGTGE